MCRCSEGYSGDPFSNCSPNPVALIPPEVPMPCNPSPCGINAVCKERAGAGSCLCMPEYHGDPYVECRPECVLNSDCAKTKACVNNKCVDPCPGVCGIDAECHVYNHIPVCNCITGYTGNPSTRCHVIKFEDPIPQNPCRPSPCGPFSECRDHNGYAICACLANYIGSPPACRPECSVSTDCAPDKACVNRKCIDPCPGTCGQGARCHVTKHSPICSCPAGHSGDPFVHCSIYQSTLPTFNCFVQEIILSLYLLEPQIIEDPQNPCVPTPCGPNSICREVSGSPSCSCLPNYIGRSPNCRPECTSNSECPANLACFNEKCRNPCPGSCGFNARCTVVNHTPSCTCETGFTGDPFTSCFEIPRKIHYMPISKSFVTHNHFSIAIVYDEPSHPCDPSPCGTNAVCKEQNGAGSCTCLPEYFGDPYSGCRPECSVNNDCSRDKACLNNKCRDPCPGVCGFNAECHVVNHSPACSCVTGYVGDPLQGCRPEIKSKRIMQSSTHMYTIYHNIF